MAVLHASLEKNKATAFNPFLILKYGRVLASLVQIELRQRYAGSLLGIAWLFLYPLIFLAIYAGVYLAIFKVRIPELSNWGYVLTVFCGLVPYIGFSESLLQGSLSLVSNINLLKNTVFPPILIPVKAVLVAQVAHGVSLVILFCMAWMLGRIHGTVWLIPVVFLFQYLLVQGLVWIISFVAIVIKDIQYVLNLLLFFILFVSPVAFTPEMAPALMQKLLKFNPLYYAIELYRYSFFGAEQFPAIELGLFAALSLIIFFFGHAFFRKNHPTLLEYV